MFGKPVMRPRAPGARKRSRMVRTLTWCVVLATAFAGTQTLRGEESGPQPFVPAFRTTFERILDRRRELERGRVLELGSGARIRNAWLVDRVPSEKTTQSYSPEADVVFELGGPGYLPTEPAYYLFDGAYYVYDPPSYRDPSIRVRARSRAQHQDALLAEHRRSFFASQLRAGQGNERDAGPGQGLTVTVPIHMPGALAEVFGRGATNIKVTGRENISFAGESRRVSPFIASEQGRGQSLFPRLDMKQDLQVKLEGTIGDKVHVEVDHNSSGFGADANRINIYYEGYDDDIVRRVDLGGTNLNLPGSNLVSFSGGARGLFGVKSVMRFGGVDLTMIASKEEADVETRTLTPSGGTPRPVLIAENSYARDRFFFYERPDAGGVRWSTYGLDPGGLDSGGQFVPGQLFDENRIPNFHVFVDDQNPNNEQERTYRGFAVEALPAGIDTTAMRQFYNATTPNGRYPQPNQNLGKWRRLSADEVGYIRFDVGNRKVVTGFFIRAGAVDRDDAVAVSFDDAQGRRVGDINQQAGNFVRLRLIRHPNQDSRFDDYPTASYMMRHVYVLGSTNVTNLEIAIASANPGRLNPEVPERIIPATTYLHMFGLDELTDNSPGLGPDGRFDFSNYNLYDSQEGLLLLPGTRPFSPPDNVVIQRLITAGVSETVARDSVAVLFPESERVPSTLYTLPANDANLPVGRYRIEVVSSGTESEIVLPQDVLEGTEVVRLDGRTLQRGTDYDIEYFAGGRITLKGDALATLVPTSQLQVSYQFRPLFGGGKSNLLGLSGNYEFGTRGRLASVWLYETTGGFVRRPKLGEEPTRTLVGDVNTSLAFQPAWMTSLVNRLPFTSSGAASSINLAAEVAVSIPNPNTRKTAFVDDLEGADDSDDQNLSRTNWNWASIPIDDPRRSDAPADTSLRVPVAFYNPVGEVKRGHLNPTLNEREINDGITVLELGFDRTRAQELLASLPIGEREQMWSGVMRSFPGGGIDLTRTKAIELWLNDYQGDPSKRHGKMHIDFGDLSEDFVFFENRPSQNLEGSPRFNREANTANEFQAALHDRGWDGIDATCDTRNPPSRFGADCYLPEVRNSNFQHYLANGTDGNNAFDTEDINNNGRWDDFNSYFSITVDLADPSLVEIDIAPRFRDEPITDPNLRNFFFGWRKYRIDLERVVLETLLDAGTSPPNLRQIRFLRVWFEDPDPLPPGAQSLWLNDLQIHGLKLTRNQYFEVGVFAVDSTQVVPAPSEIFSVGVINNKDNPSIYSLPPDAIDLDEQGVQAREQSLRIDFAGLEAGHEMVAERQLVGAGRGLDFTPYRTLTYFAHYPNPTVAMPDTALFFFRIGTDTLNYYEIEHAVPSKAPWVELNVRLDDLTGLKFPEDFPGEILEDRSLTFGTQRIRQTSARIVDANEPDLPLRVTLRGNPSLQSVTRFFVGVRHPVRRPSPGVPPVAGEIWFDNVRLEDVEREIGTAQQYSVAMRFSDVVDFSSNLSLRDADFRGLRQRAGGGSDALAFQSRVSTELSKLVPTAGFTIPLSYNYGRDRTRPKFFSQSDTRNTLERKQEQRTENVRRSYSVSVTKKPSQFWLNKVTLDRLQFSYSESRDERRTFVARDTSVSRSRNVTYDLSPRERSLTLAGLKLNLVPNNMKFALQHTSTRSRGFNVFFGDSLVARQPSATQALNVTGSMSLRPMQIVSMRYNYQEPRNYRIAHPLVERERVRLFGVDFGLPVSRSEGISVDMTPRRFRFGYSVTFGDQRVTQGSQAAFETHNASANRSRRLSFDLGLHRRVFGWLVPKKQSTGSGPEAFQAAPRSPDERPPEPFDEEGFVEPEDPEDPQPQLPDSLVAPPLPRPVPPFSTGDETPVASDSLPGIPGAGAAAPDSAEAPAQGADPVAAAADSVRAPKRRPPNPIVFVLRKLSEVEPIKVEYSDGRSASYTGLPDAPSGAFRYGFSLNSGLTGFATPTPKDNRYMIDLSTGVPIRNSLRLATKFKHESSVRESRIFGTSPLTNEDHRRDTTFPSFDLSINSIERSRIFKVFRGRLERSNVSFGFSRATNENFRLELRPNQPQVEGPGRSETERMTFNSNWTGQWRGGMSTSLGVNQTNSSTSTPGLRTEGVQRTMQGSLRFKVAPKGGLRLPFLGSKGNLKSGMDVSVNASYNTDQRTIFNDPNNPSKGRPDSNTSAIQFGVRGDYTLSRNMNGGIELGLGRTARNDRQKQSITTVRLGFNLTFLF